MQTSENIRKNDLLEELVTTLDKDSVLSIIDQDTIHILERNRMKRMIEGFISKDARYKNLSDSNADYFLETLFPLYEKNIKYVETTDDFVKIVEGVNGKVDSVKVNDRMVHAFNENYLRFCKNYPLFNYKDATTFNILEGAPYKEFVSMLHDIYEENVDKEPFSFDSYRTNLQEKLSSTSEEEEENGNPVDVKEDEEVELLGVNKNDITFAWIDDKDKNKGKIALLIYTEHDEKEDRGVIKKSVGDYVLFDIEGIDVVMRMGQPDGMFYKKKDENNLLNIAKKLGIKEEEVEDTINDGADSEDIERDEDGNPINEQSIQNEVYDYLSIHYTEHEGKDIGGVSHAESEKMRKDVRKKFPKVGDDDINYVNDYLEGIYEGKTENEKLKMNV